MEMLTLQKKGGSRMARSRRIQDPSRVLVVCFLFMSVVNVNAGNDVLGELELVGATKVEKTSGVWVDGQYLGYLKELKGSKKILLCPGSHELYSMPAANAPAYVGACGRSSRSV